MVYTILIYLRNLLEVEEPDGNRAEGCLVKHHDGRQYRPSFSCWLFLFDCTRKAVSYCSIKVNLLTQAGRTLTSSVLVTTISCNLLTWLRNLRFLLPAKGAGRLTSYPFWESIQKKRVFVPSSHVHNVASCVELLKLKTKLAIYFNEDKDFSHGISKS